MIHTSNLKSKASSANPTLGVQWGFDSIFQLQFLRLMKCCVSTMGGRGAGILQLFQEMTTNMSVLLLLSLLFFCVASGDDDQCTFCLFVCLFACLFVCVFVWGGAVGSSAPWMHARLALTS